MAAPAFFEFTFFTTPAPVLVSTSAILYVQPTPDPAGVDPDHCTLYFASSLQFEVSNAYADVKAMLTA